MNKNRITPRLKLGSLGMSFANLSKDKDKTKLKPSLGNDIKDRRFPTYGEVEESWLNICDEMPRDMMALGVRMRQMAIRLLNPDIVVLVENPLLLNQLNSVKGIINKMLDRKLNNGHIDLFFELINDSYLYKYDGGCRHQGLSGLGRVELKDYLIENGFRRYDEYVFRKEGFKNFPYDHPCYRAYVNLRGLNDEVEVTLESKDKSKYVTEQMWEDLYEYDSAEHLFSELILRAEKTYGRKCEGAKEVSFKDSYCTAEWQRKKNRILERDNYTCQICGDNHGIMQVHHITYKHCNGKAYNAWDSELITLCKDCHDHDDGNHKDFFDKTYHLSEGRLIYAKPIVFKNK